MSEPTIRDYVQHKPTCEKVRGRRTEEGAHYSFVVPGQERCTCGLDDLLAVLSAPHEIDHVEVDGAPNEPRWFVERVPSPTKGKGYTQVQGPLAYTDAVKLHAQWEQETPDAHVTMWLPPSAAAVLSAPPAEPQKEQGDTRMDTSGISTDSRTAPTVTPDATDELARQKRDGVGVFNPTWTRVDAIAERDIIVRRLAEVYTVPSDQVALIALVERAKKAVADAPVVADHTQCESDKNWLRAQRDVAEERQREAYAKGRADALRDLASATRKVLTPESVALLIEALSPEAAPERAKTIQHMKHGDSTLCGAAKERGNSYYEWAYVTCPACLANREGERAPGREKQG